MDDGCARRHVGALLAEKGWSGRPTFHLMFMTTGFFRPPARITVMDYWRTWADHPKLIRQWKREEFESAFEALRAVGVVDDTDREAFEAKTSMTQPCRSRRGCASSGGSPWSSMIAANS